MDSSNLSSQTLSVSENLNISQIDIPEIPKDIIFPDELNRFFRDQIRYYIHENGMLQKNLSDTEIDYNKCKSKIKDLEIKLKKYEKTCDGNDILNSTQVASIKIVELSKKLREKNSEVEVLKTKNSRLEQCIFELQQTPEDNKQVEKVEKPVSELEETVKKLQEKVSFTTNKLIEAKNANLQLKNELKLANKWLQKEIGENFESIHSLNNNGNWRGRSQLICDLQQKNAELRDIIKNLQDKHGHLATTKVDSKLSILSKENYDLKLTYDDLKRKNEALRARIKVIETDYTLLKSKFAMMKEQSERDQDIISTLSFQISNTRDTKNDILHQKDLTINKLQKEKNGLLKEIKEYQSLGTRFKKDLDEKNSEIEKLKTETPYTGNIQNNMKNLGRLEMERERLLELIEVQNIRLKSERDAHAKTQYALRLEKQKCTKAEATAARIELESSSSMSGSYSCSSSIKPLDFGLKDQLELAEENIKALKTRLDIEHFERSADLQEFSKILQSFDEMECSSNED